MTISSGRRRRGNAFRRLPGQPDRRKRRCRQQLGNDRATRRGRSRSSGVGAGRRARSRDAGPRAGHRARLRPRLGRFRGLLRPPRSRAAPSGSAQTLALYLKPWRPSVAARRPVSRPGPSGSRCRRYAGDSPRSRAATQRLGSRRPRNTRSCAGSCAATAAAEASRCGRRSRCSSSSGRRS